MLLSQILKEFFLLGRGELFSAFIEHAAGLLRIPPSENTEYGRLLFFIFVLVEKMGLTFQALIGI